MEIHGILWNFIEIHGNIWKFMEIYGNSQKFIEIDIHLTVVGRNEKALKNRKKISFIGHKSDPDSLMKVYDSHNIFILPSFTEAHPKVIDESLARMRPIIIFEEIQHVIHDKKGIFVSKRNTKSLLETVDFIMKNYLQIQKDMDKNILPTKSKFVSEMCNILEM